MSSVTMEWESRLGRRLRVRDLYILSSVVKSGGMAKAARQLGMTQPAVSAAIANLEHMLGVRLLDRNPRGIQPTIYAEAMLKRSTVVFDELKQSVLDVEVLADPTTGELRIGCPESMGATILPKFIEHFAKQYPRVVVHVHDVPPPAIDSPGLRDRRFDLVLTRRPFNLPRTIDDLKLEYLFDDPLVIASGVRNPLARCRAVSFAQLIDQPWLLPPPGSWNYDTVAEIFQTQNRAIPAVRLFGFSLHLVNHFVANGPFLSALPKSVARFGAMKVLPVKLPSRPWMVVIATLKNRTLNPVTERFIECVREVANTLRLAKGA